MEMEIKQRYYLLTVIGTKEDQEKILDKLIELRNNDAILDEVKPGQPLVKLFRFLPEEKIAKKDVWIEY